MASKAAPATPETVAVALPDGKTWHQRVLPDPARYDRWRRLLHAVAEQPIVTVGVTNSPDAKRAAKVAARQRVERAKERVALLAAYDGGWDVTDAAGNPLPPPAKLSLRGWNAVPRPVIEAILQHIDQQAVAGLEVLKDQANAVTAATAETAETEAPHVPAD